MIIGAATIDLIFFEPSSLKEKRQIVKSLIGRIRSKFNVSIGEVDFQDTWRRARLGVACISTEKAHANSMLSSIVNFIEKDGRANLEDYSIELL